MMKNEIFLSEKLIDFDGNLFCFVLFSKREKFEWKNTMENITSVQFKKSLKNVMYNTLF